MGVSRVETGVDADRCKVALGVEFSELSLANGTTASQGVAQVLVTLLSAAVYGGFLCAGGLVKSLVLDASKPVRSICPQLFSVVGGRFHVLIPHSYPAARPRFLTLLDPCTYKSPGINRSAINTSFMGNCYGDY